jgi:hypothetical protein
MQFAIFGAFFCLASGLVFAESWTGALVDPKCYDALERNVNPTDTLTHVDRDTNQEIRYCSPNAKTKLFGIVEQDGTILRFDSAGNAKAAELVRTIHKKDRLYVAVTGEMSGKTIKVDSISVAR